MDEDLDNLDSSIREGRHGRYIDVDGDAYAVNSDEIHRKLDGYNFRRGEYDLYDIFKAFDRDGDGIVDDIDLDDPHWTHCDVDNYDETTLRAGRYRGLTDDEWSQREAKHQRNLDELLKKQKELEDAHGEVHEALTSLSSEKASIDQEIKQKVVETEKMRDEFRKKAIEREVAERKAAMEREKAKMIERQEMRKRKSKQIIETE